MLFEISQNSQYIITYLFLLLLVLLLLLCLSIRLFNGTIHALNEKIININKFLIECQFKYLIMGCFILLVAMLLELLEIAKVSFLGVNIPLTMLNKRDVLSLWYICLHIVILII